MTYIDENLGALKLVEKWDVSIEKEIEEALGNAPEIPMDWRSWTPGISRRPH
jgi:hypothetical protein